jgi:hypothetical protein
MTSTPANSLPPNDGPPENNNRRAEPGHTPNPSSPQREIKLDLELRRDGPEDDLEL